MMLFGTFCTLHSWKSCYDSGARPAYRDASIYRSKLILASVHVILWVGFTAVISQWALDFLGIFFKSLHGVLLKNFEVKFRVQIREDLW